jgi:hypothetical protein
MAFFFVPNIYPKKDSSKDFRIINTEAVSRIRYYEQEDNAVIIFTFIDGGEALELRYNTTSPELKDLVNRLVGAFGVMHFPQEDTGYISI